MNQSNRKPLSRWERVRVRVRSMEDRIAENVAKLLEAE